MQGGLKTHLENKEEAEETWKDTVRGTAGDALWKGAPWQRCMSLRGLQPKGDPCQSKIFLWISLTE